MFLMLLLIDAVADVFVMHQRVRMKYFLWLWMRQSEILFGFFFNLVQSRFFFVADGCDGTNASHLIRLVDHHHHSSNITTTTTPILDFRNDCVKHSIFFADILAVKAMVVLAVTNVVIARHEEFEIHFCVGFIRLVICWNFSFVFLFSLHLKHQRHLV